MYSTLIHISKYNPNFFLKTQKYKLSSHSNYEKGSDCLNLKFSRS